MKMKEEQIINITADCNRTKRETGYALTEGFGAMSATEEECEHYDSVGLLASNMEAKIFDLSSGKFLRPNEKGELWLRGPTVMRGYLNNPAATAEALHPDGWLRTGDLCYFDEHGFLYVVDRLKELIKYKGLQVAPAELEAVLLSHPEILDAAVIPLSDEAAGEIPMAFVVKRTGSTLTETTVIAFVSEQIAGARALLSTPCLRRSQPELSTIAIHY